MGSLLSWLIRNPTRGAILSGIIIALFLGWVSFPSETRVEKTLRDWLPLNAATGQAAADLQAAAEAAGENAVRVSEAEFRELGLPLAQASRMVATHAADYLGVTDRGRLQDGAWADVVILDADLKVRNVFVEGQPVDLVHAR